eukprot:CAMPEP_0195284660 /NCGR_PEP_ID=MMETSP0707-20130614/2780_1 /TAXON_ID=33640 /ORGANISM="Asterionellopsis glacialis, Strain CCMP134" /LENGTH=403 /DNA_ID=CAMNT_0040344039 /DNA_START=280 /DNA_END=1488 /DNA_ORIENTATION=+
MYGAMSLALLVLSFSLTMPYMQSRRDALQCDSLCLGSMTSARSTLALVGSALMGRLSDSSSFQAYGGARKFCLLFGSFASMIGLLIAGNTFSIRGMWISMIPGALFQQNFSILKALLSDYHETIASLNGKSDRVSGNGIMGMSVGLAFMAGPLAGATLVKTYEQATQLALVCVAASAVLIIQIPVSRKKEKNDIKTDTSSSNINDNKGGIFGFLNVQAARTPAAMLLMGIRICMGLAFHIFNTIWTVSLKQRFDFGPSDHGKFMSFVGLSYALSQGIIAKLILNRVGSSNNKGRVRVLLSCCILLGIGRYIAFRTTELMVVYILFAGIITSLGVINTVLSADTSKMASSEEIGGLYGILAAVESGSGMIGPIVGGGLAYIDPIQAPLFAVVGLYGVIFCMVYW